MTQARRSSNAAGQPKKTASQAKATAAARSGSARGGASSARRQQARPARAASTRTTLVTPEAQAAPRAAILDDQARHDVAGVALGVVGVAMLVSVLAPTAGVLTKAVSDGLHALLGIGAVIVPVALVAWSLSFFVRVERLMPGRLACGLGVIALAVITALGVTTPNATADPALLLNPMVLHDRGGYVGNGLAWALLSLLGRPVSLVVVAGMVLVGLVVIGLSVSGAAQGLALRHRERRELARAQSEARAAQAARDQQAQWFDRAEGAPAASWAPTALFDPDRPLSGPAAPLGEDASAGEDTRRARQFGCGNEPMAGRPGSVTTEREGDDLGGDAASPAPATTRLGAGAPPTTFIQPASEEDDLRAALAEQEESRQSEGQTPTADRDVRPGRAARRAASVARARSANWWDGQDDDDDGDAYTTLTDVDPDLPVPGLIEGVTDVAPAAARASAAVEDAPEAQVRARVAPAVAAAPSSPVPTLQSEASGARSRVPAPATPRDVATAGAAASATGVNALGFQGAGANVAPTADAQLSGATAADRVSARTMAALAQSATIAARPQEAEVLPWETASVAAPADGQAAHPAGERTPFELPDPGVLRRNTHGLQRSKDDIAQIEAQAGDLQRTLAEFRVKAQVVDYVCGPTCTTYEVQPGEGVQVKRFTNLEDDIARVLATESVRIYAPVPGTSYVGIEVPNKKRQTVLFGDVLPYVDGGPLDFAVGLDANGRPVHVDLAKLPHLLVAGTTGSGKSVAMNAILMSMLMRDTPDELRLIIVDPKQVEFKDYDGIPHLIMPVVTDMRQAAAALQWGVTEMDRRYRVFSTLGVRDLKTYNRLVETAANAEREFPLRHLPNIVIIIDELADLMMVAGKDVEASIVRIAQLGRASGVHLVMATQRPDAKTVTGLIRANVACRIGLKVAKKNDSQIIIDQSGSEKLLGNGDMLFLNTDWGDKPRRIQGCYLSDEEIAQTVEHLKAQAGPGYDDSGMAPLAPAMGGSGSGAASAQGAEDADDATGAGGSDDDPLAWRAARLVVENQLGSTSMLQRQLKVGYARAGRVMDMLEEMGVVGPARGSKPRDVLIHEVEELDTLLGERP